MAQTLAKEFETKQTQRKEGQAKMRLVGRTAYRCALLCAIVASVWFCIATGSVMTVMLCPLIAVAGVLFTMELCRLLCFSRNPERYGKSFQRPIFYAMAAPLWVVYTIGLYALPVDAASWSEPLADALMALMMALALFVVPAAAAILGILAVAFGVKHVQTTPKTEKIPYREGPLVLACLLCALVAGLCIFGVFALL